MVSVFFYVHEQAAQILTNSDIDHFIAPYLTNYSPLNSLVRNLSIVSQTIDTGLSGGLKEGMSFPIGLLYVLPQKQVAATCFYRNNK